jgi:hypothetical protein
VGKCIRSYSVALTILKVMQVDCSRSSMVCGVVAALEGMVVALSWTMKTRMV